MVKRFLFSLVLVSCFSLAFSQINQDSVIIKERNDLFQNYTNEKASKPDPTKEDLINQVSILESIINKDNVLIDSVCSYSNTIKNLKLRVDTLSGSAILISEMNSKSKDKTNLLLYVVYGLSASVVIFIILLIVLSFIKGKSSKLLKAKITQLEDDKLKIDDEFKLFETKLEDAESNIRRVTDEKEEIALKLSSVESSNFELKSELQTKINRLENESAELNTKINRLDYEKKQMNLKQD